MARVVAIVIGVHRPDGLPELTATLNDVRQVAEWAGAAAYEVIELTDADGKRVVSSDVYAAVDGLVQTQDVERLLIFFSGHGISTAFDFDFWILSDGCRNPNGPVNVARSISLARNSGIRHVVVIGDACRTAAGKTQHNVIGTIIFPNVQIQGKVYLDWFFATRSGDPAVERVLSDDELEKAYGVFTRCLMQALRGEVTDVLEEVADHVPRRAVTAHPLDEYLYRAVPVAARKLPKPVAQIPDGVAASRLPNVICWVPDSVAPKTGTPEEPRAPRGEGLPSVHPPPPPLPESHDRAVAGPERIAQRGPPNGDDEFDIEGAIRLRVDDDARRLATPGRGHFETGTGLTVLGAPIAEAAIDTGFEGVFHEAGAYHLRASEAGGAVLDLGDGRYAATAVLPGFIGTLHVGQSGVDLVSYLPSPNSQWYEGDARNDRSREELGVLGAAARLGFRNWAIEEAHGQADALRQFKHQNPSYGILAAYAYDRAGADDQITDMLQYFEALDQHIPYDLVLLTGTDPATLSVPVVPSYPLLTHGWSLLDPEQVHAAVRAAMGSLAPSAWATPTGVGGRELFDAVQSGEVR